jgi:hypothetical protein
MIVIQTVYPLHKNQLKGRKKMREITCFPRTCPQRDSLEIDTSSYFLRMHAIPFDIRYLRKIPA